jgi:hypothetical protein
VLLADLPARLSTSDLFPLKTKFDNDAQNACMYVHRLKADRQKKTGSISIDFILHAHIRALHILLKRISSSSSSSTLTASSSSSLPSFSSYTDTYARVKPTQHIAFTIEREKESRNGDNIYDTIEE